MAQQDLLPIGTFVEHALFGSGQIIEYGKNLLPMDIESGRIYGYYLIQFENEKETKMFALSSIGAYLNVIA